MFAAMLLAVSILVAEDPTAGINDLVELLGQVDDPAVQRDLMQGMIEALRGRRDVGLPPGWAAAAKPLVGSKDAEVRRLARQLGARFGDPMILAAEQKRAADRTLALADRREALELLIERHAKGLEPLLLALLDDQDLRGLAVRGLALYSDPAVPAQILQRYPEWPAVLREYALQTLASRAAFADALLSAIEAKQLPATDVTPYHARQMVNLKNKLITERLDKLLGASRAAHPDKKELMEKYKKLLTAERLAAGDASRGRAIFEKTCSRCHTLYGEGGKVGPDLTGSNRNNLDYVLENVLDPSARIGRGFQMVVLELHDGRLLTGMVTAQDPHRVTLQTPSEAIVVPKSDIAEETLSPLSLMPEGIFDTMKLEEVCDVIAYLGTKQQVEKK